MNPLDFIRVLFSGAGAFQTVSTVLSFAGAQLKVLDQDHTGLDDIAGDAMLASGRLFAAIGSGERNKTKLAIQAAREALDVLENHTIHGGDIPTNDLVK